MVRVALQRRREPTLFITEFVAEVIPKRRIHKRLRSLGFATYALATLESRRGSDPRSPAGFPEGRSVDAILTVNTVPFEAFPYVCLRILAYVSDSRQGK